MCELLFIAPQAAAYFALHDALYSSAVLLECDDCAFNDLGKLMLGGVFLAVVVGGAITLLRLCLRSRRPSSAQFVSINPSKHDE
jgi:hypothetical protein